MTRAECRELVSKLALKGINKIKDTTLRANLLEIAAEDLIEPELKELCLETSKAIRKSDQQQLKLNNLLSKTQ